MKNQLEAYASYATYAKTRLQLLCQLDHERRWHSLDDTRHCILCEQTISGRNVRIIRRQRESSLRCPTRGCMGTPREWVHAGNPLISEEAWLDWMRLLDTLCDEEATRSRPIRRFHPNRLRENDTSAYIGE